MKVIVKVPATTANLGPGFDALGLALDLWNETVFITTDIAGISISINGEGREQLPLSEDNTIIEAVKYIFNHAQKQMPGLTVQCQNHIPISSGLGSSSAALLTGFLGGNALMGSPFSNDEILKIATKIEKHPDNVAPAILGGLVASMVNQEKIISIKLAPFSVTAPIFAIVVLPDFEFSTQEARKILPEMVSRTDAVFNISRSILVAEALRTSDFSLLEQAMDDRIHQPYRLGLIPGSREAMLSAKKNGAISVALSGAGPSLIAFSSKNLPQIAQAMQIAFQKAGLSSRVFELKFSHHGAIVEIE